MKREDFELLAPVGSFESLAAAIQAGSNGIYFGVEQLNMRAKSSYNFTLNDLEAVVDTAHKNNLKAYLTVNTIIYDHEIKLMQTLVYEAKRVGVDAIIVSDQAAMLYAKKIGMPVHISTQLNVSNLETLRFYAQYADTMVLARELSLNQVKYLMQKIKEENITGSSGDLVKIEIFIHGALCMAISGKCYLSLHEFNSSANRGACQQTCRRGYDVTDNETGYQLTVDNEYIMSPKDLATFFFFDQIIDSGATVFKIEGRARSADYVKKVVEVYDDVINTVIAGKFSKEKIAFWEKELATVYNRGFWDGYYLGRKMGDWSKVYGSKATKRKIYIGRITNYFKKIKVAEITVDSEGVNEKDKLMIIGPTTGVVETIATNMMVNDRVVNSVDAGMKCSLAVPTLLRRSDKVYKIVKT
ncbi:MAG: U32 family peptidase [Bacteroidales bacterium]|nr:U32 family peptidase [Bacteroidales bacterium]